MVAALSPWSASARRLGPPAVAATGFAALPVRACCSHGHRSVCAGRDQILDGITAAVFSVMVPLVVADLTRGTGHFNLAQGIVGTFVGIGASLSATLAGYLTDHFGSPSPSSGSR